MLLLMMMMMMIIIIIIQQSPKSYEFLSKQKRFPGFCKTHRLSTVFTTARHYHLS
jgi:hypothetical protein